MVRRLVAVLVPLLLGITPSLALACDAHCLDQHGLDQHGLDEHRLDEHHLDGQAQSAPAGSRIHTHAGHSQPGSSSQTDAARAPATQPHVADHHMRHARAAQADRPRQSDAVSGIGVTAVIHGDEPVHVGCMAAFDEGTLDRHPVAAGMGHAPAGSDLYSPTRAGRPAAPQPELLSLALPCGRAATPLRI